MKEDLSGAEDAEYYEERVASSKKFLQLDLHIQSYLISRGRDSYPYSKKENH